MPEMPEVEIIKRSLQDRLVGRTIQQVDIMLPRLIKWPTADRFQAITTGKKITSLTRRGKYLLFGLEDDLVIVVHLRMTGKLLYSSANTQQDRFSRIKFYLDNGDMMQYADSRTLGTLYAMSLDELWRITGLSSMGPEPLSEDFTLNYLKEGLKKHKGNIKALLLNQRFIGGLGNIYVDESLAIAGIHPERKADSVTESEVDKLFSSINAVIRDGIEHGGTTFRDYRDGNGHSGSHQFHLRVYGRKLLPCLICGTPIVKIEVAGRGTHYCPNCQR
ncbi:Formamidopyrimidine-DNA glycosylase [bioreactor metagenome]|uniref:Formamidopyrimidine-DNA glycosylase n=1 Tax=bioreactor metagenome TaxID=1076179 RepID=A0A644URL6_9ZZZZ|nr:DNA-formamidopyrimidine glycosylase [Negativicutes bacterium]